jgi:hypothetical protein
MVFSEQPARAREKEKVPDRLGGVILEGLTPMN